MFVLKITSREFRCNSFLNKTEYWNESLEARKHQNTSKYFYIPSLKSIIPSYATEYCNTIVPAQTHQLCVVLGSSSVNLHANLSQHFRHWHISTCIRFSTCWPAAILDNWNRTELISLASLDREYSFGSQSFHLEQHSERYLCDCVEVRCPKVPMTKGDATSQHKGWPVLNQ